MNLSSPTSIKPLLTRREFVLQDILPHNHHAVLSHVFIGFTQDGKYFLSYTSQNEEDDPKKTTLHIWLFRLNSPMRMLSSHVVFSPTDMFANSFVDEIDQLPDGVYCYQWPGDDHYLLTVIAPNYPTTHLIHVSVIRMDKDGSYLLSPGTLDFSYNGFGMIDTYMNDFKEHTSLTLNRTPSSSPNPNDDPFHLIHDAIYSPTILMGHKRVCAFSTVCEIVCLEIREKVQEGVTSAHLVSEVFDVESEIFDKGFAKLNCLELTYFIDAYELLVYDIECDPVKVHFLVDVCFKKDSKLFFHSYLVVWEPKTRVWDVTMHSDNSQRSLYYSVMTDLVRAETQSFAHSINNLSLTENHKSLARLDSPVDDISIILKPSLSPDKS
jgi:hypothetical protein